MIDCIKNTTVYKSLNLNNSFFHACLFYSFDKVLNNNVALNYAKSILCENKNGCGTCFACKQFDSNSHPDFVLIDQNQVKVEDANAIIDKLNTKPISAKHKVFVILNAENINETAQNKLLKSLEEPNESSIFILTSAKTDKLLPTVLSRLYKFYVPKLMRVDKSLIAGELKKTQIDISKYVDSDFSLTEMINYTTNQNYIQTLNEINKLFLNLKTSQDIPIVVSSLGAYDKNLFLPILEDIFLDCLNSKGKFDAQTLAIFKSNFNEKAIVKCLPLIEEAYKKQMSNVNFSYILDNLLFNILKEKFLCKQ